jgi:mercuric reductase
VRTERHDAVVIGAGTAGFAAAEALRAAGRDFVLVTGRDELGGTCILRGCMPAKTLLAAAQYEGEIAKARVAGVETGSTHVDLPKIIRRKAALVDYFAEDRVAELETYPLVRGDARFVTPDTIAVGERRISAHRFIVATGASTALPPIDGIGAIATLTSTDVLEMTSAPARVVVLGGGPIGCSFAQFFARVGSRVTLLQDAPELLRNEDADIGTAVRAVLERDGVEVICDADARRAFRDGETSVVVAQTPDGPHEARADVVLVATNRLPLVEQLDLVAGGIEGDRARGILVDAALRSVSNASVYAAGDVLGRRNLVHTAAYAGALAARNAFADTPVDVNWRRWEMHALYTQPQVAVIGRTERDCRAEHIDVEVTRSRWRPRASSS